jgi:DNA-binding NtrC family response regulator
MIAGQAQQDAPMAPPFELAEQLASRYARLNRPVVLVGPVGSGKSTLARRIHDLSGRSGPLITVSAGELSDQLYADVLFGHVGGAFTGAKGERRGAFQLASNGTLLLDDVVFMRPEAQSAILRAVEDRSVRPLGASRDVLIASREIYAMTKHPDDLIDREVLLPDLKSRMGEFIIELPSLSERAADIPRLCVAYAEEFAREHRLERVPLPSDSTLAVLAEYPWPGNLRELRSVVERSSMDALHSGSAQVTPQYLPARILHAPAAPPQRRLTPELARYALSAAGGNKTKAAESLGVHRNTLSRYLSEGAA